MAEDIVLGAERLRRVLTQPSNLTLQNRLLPASDGKKGPKLLKQSVDLGKFLTSKLIRAHALHLNMFEREVRGFGQTKNGLVERLKRNQMVQESEEY